jgi:LacI family transcriptional regulator
MANIPATANGAPRKDRRGVAGKATPSADGSTTTPATRRAPQAGDPAKRPATLHAVAAAAGCSTATVSKALNGLPVSPENLKRVLAAVEEVGYIPNLAARSMRNVRSMTIGMAVNFEGHPRNELMTVFQSMIGQLETLGYNVLLSVVRSSGVDIDTLLRRFIAHRVDGLFYWNAEPTDALSLYKQANVPVIAVGFRSAGCEHLPLVSMNGSPPYESAIAHLKALGHSYVAEFAVDRGIFTHKLFVPPRRMRWLDLKAGHSRDEVQELLISTLSKRQPPTAVFATMAVALEILSICEEHGIRVPEDLSVVALSDSEAAPLLRTPLSSIRSDYTMIGLAAASAMLDALDGKPTHDIIVEDSATYIPRGSTGPARR